jgi:TPR repeat protein
MVGHLQCRRRIAYHGSWRSIEVWKQIVTPTFRTISAGIVLALSFAAPVAADSIEDAVAAYRSANYATALRVYHSLAEQGSAVAQFNLGLMYDIGQGVPQNYPEAVKWYRLAADQGRADAHYQLGHLYYKQNNYAEAAKWFHLAADQGRADAQSNLGAMYAEGEGLPQDFVLALMWFSLSAAQNHKDAIENRDQAALFMSPTQIAEAQKLARKWKPTTQPIRQPN